MDEENKKRCDGLDKGKPAARQGRKATGLSETAELPKDMIKCTRFRVVELLLGPSLSDDLLLVLSLLKLRRQPALCGFAAYLSMYFINKQRR